MDIFMVFCKIERACYYNVSFIWFMEGLKPDNKTISEFRKNNYYYCSEGYKLLYGYFSKQKKIKKYRFSSAFTCRSCKYFVICTKAKKGREISREE